jgi:hypothetical protein
MSGLIGKIQVHYVCSNVYQDTMRISLTIFFEHYDDLEVNCAKYAN